MGEAILLLLDLDERAVGGHNILDELQTAVLVVFYGTAQPQCAVIATNIVFPVKFTHAVQTVVQKCFFIQVDCHLSILYFHEGNHFPVNMAVGGQDFIFIDRKSLI